MILHNFQYNLIWKREKGVRVQYSEFELQRPVDAQNVDKLLGLLIHFALLKQFLAPAHQLFPIDFIVDRIVVQVKQLSSLSWGQLLYRLKEGSQVDFKWRIVIAIL